MGGGPESRPIEGETQRQGTPLGGDLYRRIQSQEQPQQQGQWRQTYGGDVGQTTGQNRQGNGSDPYYRGPRQDGRWRHDPFNRGGDSFKPGGQQQPPPVEQPRQPGQQGGQPPVEDPNRNGNQPSGPKYNPKTPYTFNDKQPDNGMGPGTGPKGGPGGSRPAGPLDQIIAQKERAMNGLKNQSNMMLTNAAGGFVGGALAEPLFTGGGSKAADWVVKKTEPAEGATRSWSGRLAEQFQSNYDPKKFFSADLQKQTSRFDDLHGKVTEIVKSEASQLDDLARLAEGTTPLTAEQQQTMARLMERQKWIGPQATEWGEAASGARRLESLKNLAKTNFTAAEIELLESRQLALAAKADLAAQAQAAKELKTFSGGQMLKNGKSGLMNMIAATGLKALDGGVSKMMNTEEGSLTSLTVPMALAYGKQMGMGRTKTGLYALGAIGAAHAADVILPDSIWRNNTTSVSGVEAVLLGGAFAVPTKDMRARALLVGGAWGAGRLYNMMRGDTLADKAQDALDSLKEDKEERSFGSLSDSTNQFKKVARGETFFLQGDKIGLYKNDGNVKKTGEPVIQAQLASEIDRMKREWGQMPPGDKLQGLRNVAILSTALGENRLDMGTRILKENKPVFALQGYGLDLGGDALMYLQMAKKEGVEKAKSMTQKLIADNPDGEYKSGEIADLDKFGQRINANMDKIYGKHDIDGAFDELKKFIPGNENTFGKTFLDNINNKIANNATSGDSKMVAKLFRDLAMSYMALASNKMDRGKDGGGAVDLMFGTDQGRQLPFGRSGKARGYDGALDCLRAAKQLDPSNEDLAQLLVIAEKLANQAREKAAAQQADSTTNPLNVNDGLYKK